MLGRLIRKLEFPTRKGATPHAYHCFWVALSEEGPASQGGGTLRTIRTIASLNRPTR